MLCENYELFQTMLSTNLSISIKTYFIYWLLLSKLQIIINNINFQNLIGYNIFNS